ncbi:MAG: iron-containing redox enzyme family protein, partial [Gemmatimonadaceae bacterium]
DILSAGPLDTTLVGKPGLEHELIEQATSLAARAHPSHATTERQSARWIDHSARDLHHRALLALYQQHMRLPNHGLAVNQFHPLACRLTGILESAWERDTLARARASAPLSLSDLPSDPGLFVEWYRRTAFNHPLYEHELHSFLASEATREQIHWFFTMESAGEAAFDDLVALSQVGTRGDVKLEMASNYWDEMGNGKEHAVHTHLFQRLANDLAVTAPSADVLPWQVLSGVNLMLWCCISRRNAFRAQGALGAVELLAPQRCTRVVHGAYRVGIPKKTMSYYGAHAIIDIGHAEGWLERVVRAQVADIPDSRVGIAEGLVSRADASLDYFDYCLAELRAM